jgi:hypothetical protein
MKSYREPSLETIILKTLLKTIFEFINGADSV